MIKKGGFSSIPGGLVFPFNIITVVILLNVLNSGFTIQYAKISVIT